MIKRTIYVSSAAYLHLKNEQMHIQFDEADKEGKMLPVEDIGILILDNHSISISQGLCNALLENNTVTVWCNWQHLPHGMMLPIAGNNTFTETLRAQINASVPLKKQLWKSLIQAKIKNQQDVLFYFSKNAAPMSGFIEKVRSGDPDNVEGRSSYHYWQEMLRPYGVSRKRDAGPPNHFLNYAYAILRAVSARNLVGSGLLPSLGIFHSNKYNPYCLADDIMEPYRPIVDRFVFEYISSLKHPLPTVLNKEDKAQILKVPVLDVEVDDKKGPLMVAMQRTTAGLVKYLSGEVRKIPLPNIILDGKEIR